MKVSYKTPTLFSLAILLLLILLLLLQENNRVVAADQTCDPTELSPCVDTIIKGSEPSDLCCKAVVKQKPCLCQYMKNSTFKTYLKSPNAKKISTECHVPFPKC